MILLLVSSAAHTQISGPSHLFAASAAGFCPIPDKARRFRTFDLRLAPRNSFCFNPLELAAGLQEQGVRGLRRQEYASVSRYPICD